MTSSTRSPLQRPAMTAVAGRVLLVALSCVGARGGETSASVEPGKHETYARVADHLKLYHNEDNSVIQSFALNGVYQGQYWSVNAAQGSADGWENRRMYLGAAAEFFHQFKLQAQVKLGEDLDPVYDGLHTAFVNWTPNQAFSLSVGRVDYFFFLEPDRSLSSTRISTFERGLVVNQVLPQEMVGAMLEAKRGRFSGHAGLVSGSIQDEFTDFAGGYGLLAGVNYELPLFYDAGNLHLDYVFNNGNPSNNALKPYDDVVSLWHEGQAGPIGLSLGLIGGHGLGARPAVFGVTVQPTWVFAKDVLRQGDALQAVLRYQFAVSNGDNGLKLQPRYEQEVVPGAQGDQYDAVYAGLNYLILGHRLKLMSGVEYSWMHDAPRDGGAFSGWTFLTGLRLSL